MNGQNFKIAIRRISRNYKSNLLIFTGLVFGFTSCFVIFTKTSYELSYDRAHTKSHQIYRVVRVTSGLEYTEGGLEYRTGVYFPLPGEIRKNVPGVNDVVSMMYVFGQKVEVPSVDGSLAKKFQLDDGIVFIDAAFFDVFDYGKKGIDWIKGDKQDLDEPFTAVITRDIAERFFPGVDPSGRRISIFGSDYTIRGVIADLPVNSDFPFKILLSMRTFTEKLNPGSLKDWGSLSDNYQCYVTLNKTVRKDSIEKKFKELYAPHAYDDYAERRLFKLQALPLIHREARFGNYNGRTVSSGLITALMLTGIFIFLIASFNYSNFFIAESAKQHKQIALKLIVGSRPVSIFIQLITESSIINSCALLVSTQLASEIIKNYYSFIDIPQNFSPAIDIKTVLFILGLFITGSTLPVLLSLNHLKLMSLSGLLKGNILDEPGNSNRFGKISVILQFIVAQTVIIATLFIVKQIYFINNRDLGYTTRSIIYATLPDNPGSKMAALSQELLSVPGVQGVSFSSILPAESRQWTSFSTTLNNQEIKLDGEIKFIDSAYLKLYSFRLTAGHNFSINDTAGAVIVNREFLTEAGLKNEGEAVGTIIKSSGDKLYIKGVVDDFNSGSLRNEIRPCVFYNNSRGYRIANIRLSSEDKNVMPGIVDHVREKWAVVFPGQEFRYQFLDETIALYYRSDHKAMNLFLLFSIITIFLCILGIMGLSFSMNERRTKEIGLRKVNGANITEVLILLNRDFIKWIAIAFVISVPVSWYFVFRWLQNFAFKTNISLWVFVTGCLLSMVIGLLAVTLQSFRAATGNPVESLRYE